MPGMDQIKASIGKDNGFPLPTKMFSDDSDI
jgi:hypothetical protein